MVYKPRAVNMDMKNCWVSLGSFARSYLHFLLYPLRKKNSTDHYWILVTLVNVNCMIKSLNTFHE